MIIATYNFFTVKPFLYSERHGKRLIADVRRWKNSKIVTDYDIAEYYLVVKNQKTIFDFLTKNSKN